MKFQTTTVRRAVLSGNSAELCDGKSCSVIMGRWRRSCHTAAMQASVSCGVVRRVRSCGCGA